MAQKRSTFDKFGRPGPNDGQPLHSTGGAGEKYPNDGPTLQPINQSINRLIDRAMRNRADLVQSRRKNMNRMTERSTSQPTE